VWWGREKYADRRRRQPSGHPSSRLTFYSWLYTHPTKTCTVTRRRSPRSHRRPRSSTPQQRATPARPPSATNHGGERTGEPPLQRWCRLLHRDDIPAAAGRTAGDAGASDRRP